MPGGHGYPSDSECRHFEGTILTKSLSCTRCRGPRPKRSPQILSLAAGTQTLCAQAPLAIVWRCLRDPTFGHFEIILASLTCDRQTHDDSIWRASIAPRGKETLVVFDLGLTVHPKFRFWLLDYVFSSCLTNWMKINNVLVGDCR